MSTIKSPERFIQFLKDYHEALDEGVKEGVDVLVHKQITEVYNDIILGKYQEYRESLGSKLPEIRQSVNLARRKLEQIQITPTRHPVSEVSQDMPSAIPKQTEQTTWKPGIVLDSLGPSAYLGLNPSHSKEAKMFTLTGFQLEKGFFPGNIGRMIDNLRRFPMNNALVMDKHLSDFNRHIYQPYLEIYRDLSPEQKEIGFAVFRTQEILIKQMTAYVKQTPIRNDQDLGRYMSHFKENIYKPYLKAYSHLPPEMSDQLGRSVFELHKALAEQVTAYLKKPLIMNEQMLQRYKVDYFNECILLPYKDQAHNVRGLDRAAIRDTVINVQRALDTRIQALKDSEKRGWLNWGLAAIPAIGTYMALPALTNTLPMGLGSYLNHPWFLGIAALGTGALLVGRKKSLSEGGRATLGLTTLSGVQVAGNALGSSSILTTFRSLSYAGNILSQPTMMDSTKEMAKAVSALGIGFLATTCSNYLGSDPYLLVPIMATTAMSNADMAFASSTWGNALKRLGKGGLTIGAGLAVQGGLNYLGVPIIASSAIASSVTQSFASLLGSKSAKEALEKTARTVLSVGSGLLTYKIYSAAGVEAVPKQICGKSKEGETICVTSYKDAYENGGATMNATMSASVERKGTLRKQLWETAKDISLAVGGSALISNLSRFGVPSGIRTLISGGFGLWRARHMYQAIYNQTQGVGQALMC